MEHLNQPGITIAAGDRFDARVHIQMTLSEQIVQILVDSEITTILEIVLDLEQFPLETVKSYVGWNTWYESLVMKPFPHCSH